MTYNVFSGTLNPTHLLCCKRDVKLQLTVVVVNILYNVILNVNLRQCQK